MRRATLLAVLALPIAGCGASDEAQIRDTLMQAAHALASRDYKKVCSLMTDRQQKLVARLDPKRTESCARALKDSGVPASKTMTNQLHAVKVTKVTINGATATANVTPIEIFGPSQPLKKVDGHWLIDTTG